ncbi:hypothetical protein [Streptomyces sp. NPDC101132]|uniref:hypothetical protein n=1 Tax=Streptomyces sp. NPDC101132 TaxID=3366110 RepID=UPI00380610EF
MQYRISAPVTDFTGVSAGVNFTAGVAEIDVPDDAQHPYARALAYFRQAGYHVEPEVEAPAAPVQDEGDAPFDPGQHTVDEVIEYLDSVADDEDEVMRVLLAEADGKARKTITERNAS